MADPTPERLDLYHQMAVHLFPRGIAWFDSGTSGTETKEDAVRALAKEPARLFEEYEAYLESYMPDTASGEGLAGWERILALDPTGLTEAERRAQVLTKLRGNSDPTLANLQLQADAWSNGAIVTEHDYSAFQMGVSSMGDSIGSAWLTVLTVTYNGPANPAFEASMRAGLQYHVTIYFIVV